MKRLLFSLFWLNLFSFCSESEDDARMAIAIHKSLEYAFRDAKYRRFLERSRIEYRDQKIEELLRQLDAVRSDLEEDFDDGIESETEERETNGDEESDDEGEFSDDNPFARFTGTVDQKISAVDKTIDDETREDLDQDQESFPEIFMDTEDRETSDDEESDDEGEFSADNPFAAFGDEDASGVVSTLTPEELEKKINELVDLLSEVEQDEKEKIVRSQVCPSAQKIAVLRQTKSECGQQAIKNAELGVLSQWFKNNGFKILLTNQEYFGKRFNVLEDNIACDRNLLDSKKLADALQKSAQSLEGDFSNYNANDWSDLAKDVHKKICIVETWDMYDALTAEQETVSMVELAQDDCFVGFVVNTGGHWVAYTIKKVGGVVINISFYDSNSGTPDQRTVQKICQLAYQSKKRVEEIIKKKNLENWVYDISAKWNHNDKTVNKVRDIVEGILKDDFWKINGRDGAFFKAGLSNQEQNDLFRLIKTKKLFEEQIFLKEFNSVADLGE